MKKAMIILGKRILLSKETSNGVLDEIINKAYAVIESELGSFDIKNYSREDVHSNEVKSRIDTAVRARFLNVIFDLKGKIPGLYDCSGRMQLKTPLLHGHIPDVAIEVVEFTKGDKDSVKLAVLFETEPLVLLDSIGDKLLLSFPSETGAEDAEQTYFENTFFLQLTDDIYFKDYKILQS